MARSKRGRNLKDWKSNRAEAGTGKLRIIGGEYRGKVDRVFRRPSDASHEGQYARGAFQLDWRLGPGKTVFDLFAGTGAIGLESLSRGAESAVFVERHFPTVKIIEQNIESLEPKLKDRTSVHASDTFFWVRGFIKQDDRPQNPWMVFCCPPTTSL